MHTISNYIIIKIVSQKIVIFSHYGFIVPLTNNVIIKLNEITTVIEDKNDIKENEVEEIKQIFLDLLKNGEQYNVDEIESWFENEGTWSKKDSRVRVSNLSHYIQSKFEQTDRFRIISDTNDKCGCEN